MLFTVLLGTSYFDVILVAIFTFSNNVKFGVGTISYRHKHTYILRIKLD